jgi:hypothetical protein
MDDVRAVMQAAQSDHAALFGYSEGAAMSILFAATYPDRVSALILGAATARYRPAPGYPCGKGSEAMFASLTEIAQQRWGQGASIDWFLPSRADSSHARRLFARFERMSITPSAFLRIVRMVREIDVRAVLPTIHVPTLVIQRLDDRMSTPCHGRYLASHIPSARYFEQPGDHSLRFATSGDIDRLLNEIENFLSAVPRPTQPDRVLTTILNIEPAVQARDNVLAHRGRLIQHGEALVATFDSPWPRHPLRPRHPSLVNRSRYRAPCRRAHRRDRATRRRDRRRVSRHRGSDREAGSAGRDPGLAHRDRPGHRLGYLIRRPRHPRTQRDARRLGAVRRHRRLVSARHD